MFCKIFEWRTVELHKCFLDYWFHLAMTTFHVHHHCDWHTAEIAREIEESESDQLTEEARIQLTRTFITDHLALIESWAEETVEAEGFSYPVQGELGIRWIPDREYDGLYFPAGNYEALTLTIGEGSGQNWWCVIYPPLCLIDSSEKMREELGEARFQAWLDSMGGGRIVLKSRIMEILSRK